MKPLNKTLMTSAAALLIASGSAFAESHSADAEVNADAEVSTEMKETGNDMETAAEETGDAIENTAEDVADAVENTAEDAETATEDMVADTEDAIEEDAEMTADAEGSASIDPDMAAAADMQISALIGLNVVSQTGNDVGEIDNFVQANGEIMAVIGIGGFLGLGEHDIAIGIDRLTVNQSNEEGEPTEFMISGYSEAQLEEMEEFDPETATVIDSEVSLRSAIEG
ncbi:MAG TPA: hypothetical protein DEO85_09770 [Maritimibacter sp.]|nr:hypothetical protein [Maritimibacter sp.]